MLNNRSATSPKVKMVPQLDRCQKIGELARRRGFFWSSYELYGGESGFIDYGPLGTLLKRRIEEKWIETFVRHEGLMLIETPIISPGTLFEASGHTTHFTDPITACRRCGRKWRADHLLEDQARVSGEGLDIQGLEAEMRMHEIRCPECGGDLDAPQPFNELFKTTIGPYSERVGYGRPETAQGIFANFKRLNELARGQLPFGVAQVGKCMRNEISPRQGPIRLRELTIMEFEFFFDPENSKCHKMEEVADEVLRLLPDNLIRSGAKIPVDVSVKEALKKGYIKAEWNAYFMAKAKIFVAQLGIPEANQFFKEKLIGERAHYSTQTFDQVVELSRWGYVEVSGHALRSDYDLKMHMVHSGEDLRAFTQHEKTRHVKCIVIAPNKKALGEAFKEEASHITRLLELASPVEVKDFLAREGFYSLRGDGKVYRILPEHITVEEVDMEESGRRFIPYVVEPSFGLDRLVYATLEYAYMEKDGRVILGLPRTLVPIQVAVFPLLNRDELPRKAQEVYQMLMEEGFATEYDDAGSIGKRYARMDEAGTPLAITVDHTTLEDGTVTVRDRDSWNQVMVGIKDLPLTLTQYFKGKLNFDQLDKAHTL